MQPIKMLANNIKNVYNISLIKKERIRKQYDENSPNLFKTYQYMHI